MKYFAREHLVLLLLSVVFSAGAQQVSASDSSATPIAAVTFTAKIGNGLKAVACCLKRYKAVAAVGAFTVCVSQRPEVLSGIADFADDFFGLVYKGNDIADPKVPAGLLYGATGFRGKITNLFKDEGFLRYAAVAQAVYILTPPAYAVGSRIVTEVWRRLPSRKAVISETENAISKAEDTVNRAADKITNKIESVKQELEAAKPVTAQ